MQIVTLMSWWRRVYTVHLPIELQLLLLVIHKNDKGCFLWFKLGLNTDSALHYKWISDTMFDHTRRDHSGIHGLHLWKLLFTEATWSCRTVRTTSIANRLRCLIRMGSHRRWVLHLNEFARVWSKLTLAWLSIRTTDLTSLWRLYNALILVQKRKLLCLQALIASLLWLCVSLRSDFILRCHLHVVLVHFRRRVRVRLEHVLRGYQLAWLVEHLKTDTWRHSFGSDATCTASLGNIFTILTFNECVSAVLPDTILHDSYLFESAWCLNTLELFRGHVALHVVCCVHLLGGSTLDIPGAVHRLNHSKNVIV